MDRTNWAFGMLAAVLLLVCVGVVGCEVGAGGAGRSEPLPVLKSAAEDAAAAAEKARAETAAKLADVTAAAKAKAAEAEAARLAAVAALENQKRAELEKVDAAAQRAADLAKAEADAKAAKLAAESAAAAEAQNRIKDAEAQATKYAALAQKFSDVLQKTVRPDGSVDVGAAAVGISQMVPLPYAALVTIGGALIGGFLRDRRAKQQQAEDAAVLAATKKAQADAEAARDDATAAARSIVNSIDVLRIKDPAVAAAMSEHQNDIRKQLTPVAAQIVDAERLQ